MAGQAFEGRLGRLESKLMHHSGVRRGRQRVQR